MHNFVRVIACLAALIVSLAVCAVDDANGESEDATTGALKAEDLTLERLFPEKGLFGPSAQGTGFSHDGRYAAYLYRPYVERRHGSDLWIYDTQTREARRITSAPMMAEFQESSRKVRDDRIEKAKKAKKKDASQKDGADEVPQDGISGTWKGNLKGGEALGLPPTGLTFELSLRVAKDGAVSGRVETSMSKASIVEGRYDFEGQSLSCAIEDEETQMRATLEATVDGDTMRGKIAVEGTETTLAFEATRQANGSGTDEDSGSDEGQDDEDQDDEEKGDAEQDDDDKREDREKEDEKKEQEDELGHVVDKDDADAKDAPRYGGVSTYEWSPVANELIFTASGDLYRYVIDEDRIDRLTRTRESERDVQYLPDGSGYSYRRDGSLLRVSFGSHLIEQLDPRLTGGETMSGYSISPDGRRLVFLATKGGNFWAAGRDVNIVNYRDRFAQVRSVKRHMPDDPLPEFEWSIYLYEIADYLGEKGVLKKVYSHKRSGPRDAVPTPEWAPDSSRVTFAVFEQSTGQVEILEAGIREPEPEDEDTKDAEPSPAGGAAGASDGDDDERGEDETASKDDEDEDAEEVVIEDARVVYRFLHHGGPNTPSMIRPHYLADSRRIVFLAEMSGYRHLHVLDPVYEHLEPLTRGRFEVYPVDYSPDHKRAFLLANPDDPAQRHAFTVDLDTGELTRLSTVEGYYDQVAFSPDGTRALGRHVDFGSLRELVALEADAEEPVVLTDSHPDEARTLTEPIPEYFTYENRHGQTIHGHMFKPADWSPDDKRPLLIYVYGGPLGSRNMATRGSFSAPSYFFAYYMAKKHGFVTCTIDPRGTSGYGGLFEKSNFEQVGKPQVEDLVDGARWFAEHQGVDAKRIGMHGWSFGGFQTQMCLYTEPKVFACGIAGAGPTEWENYNSWYSTGTIGENRKGKTDLAKFSLLPLAKNLEARLLLVHGMEDSNVLYQDTVRVYRELLKAGKEALVELFLDPTGGHGLGGDVKTINRYRKYEEFLLRTLGTGEASSDAEATESVDESAEEAAETP